MSKKNEEIEAEIVEEKGIVLAPVTDLVLVEGIDLDALLKTYTEVPQIDPEAENAGEQYQYVLKGHKAFVKARNKIEKVRKILKAPALEYNRDVEARANELKAKIASKELELFTQRKLVEDNEQRKQDELIEKERIRVDHITKTIDALRNLPLVHINSDSNTLKLALNELVYPHVDVFEEYLETAIVTHTTTVGQLEATLNTKVKAENSERLQAEQEAKQKQKDEEIEAERAKDREKFEAEKAEFERQKNEQNRVIQEQQENINRQNVFREAEEAERQERKRAEELAKQQESERIKKEKENKELFEQRFNDAYDAIKKCNEAGELVLDCIIEGKIPFVRWEG